MPAELLRTLTNSNFLALLAISQAACGGSTEALSTMSEGSPAGNLNMVSCTYEADDIKYSADCGTLFVPENRGKSKARLIALPITRIRAARDAPSEPIFWLSGGPGSSNMRDSLPTGLIEDHEIVMVGYRGADGSVTLDCPKVTQAWRGTGGNLLSSESLTNIGEAFSDCATRLQAEAVDLDGYTLPEVIEDMEAARIALGYERVNLLSGSYGTRLAMFYASLHPNAIHRSVMYAVNTPGHFVWEPETIDEMIEYDSDLCSQDPECSSRTDNLAESMHKVVHSMPRRWLFIPIDPGKVRVTTHFLLFHRRSAATAYDLYLAAEAGDPSGLALASLMYDFIWPPMNTWGEWANKGGIDYNRSRDWVTEMDPPGSILGSPLSLAAGGQGQLASS